MTASRHIPYGMQTITDIDIEAVSVAMRGNFLTGGDEVAKFEAQFAEFVGARYAVAVANGTAALHIAYVAAGLGDGDEFITSPLTFAATANAGLYLSAKPVFADILYYTGNIDPAEIEAKVTPKTAMLAPVHYGGQACDMRVIKAIADKHGLAVIEDACHAIGGRYDCGAMVGSCKYSDMAAFSMHPVKNITTGEGGIITMNSEELYKKLLLLRSHGIQTNSKMPWKKDMVLLGFNYRITDFQCALGASQLGQLGGFLSARRRIAAKYDSAFRGLVEVTTKSVGHAHHLYTILLPDGVDRDAFIAALHNAGIGAQVHYGLVYNHPYYQENGFSGIYLENAERFSARSLSIPIYPLLTDDDQQYVIDTIKSLLS